MDFLNCGNKDLTPEQLVAALLTKDADGNFALRTMEVDACAEDAINCANGSLPIKANLAKTIGITACGKPALRIAVEKPYKVYSAFLTQVGSAAPVATVLENTIGDGIVWSRLAASQYRATLTGAFTVGKTVILLDALNLFALSSIYVSRTTSINNVTLQASDSVDDYLTGMFIEIRVYK